MKHLYDKDCNLAVLDGKTIAIIGFGSQGLLYKFGPKSIIVAAG